MNHLVFLSFRPCFMASNIWSDDRPLSEDEVARIRSRIEDDKNLGLTGKYWAAIASSLGLPYLSVKRMGEEMEAATSNALSRDVHLDVPASSSLSVPPTFTLDRDTTTDDASSCFAPLQRDVPVDVATNIAPSRFAPLFFRLLPSPSLSSSPLPSTPATLQPYVHQSFVLHVFKSRHE